MRVSRIEIFGFKSFMDRVVIPLDQGITGVVGPNGCGKSNIVDAIRWVLGETRARSLRGDLLEDVIFNGTDTLRPLGLAEVSITMRSDSNSLLEDLTSPDLEAELVEEAELALLQEEQKDAAGTESVESEEVPHDSADSAAHDSVTPDGVAHSERGRPQLTVIRGGAGLPHSESPEFQEAELQEAGLQESGDATAAEGAAGSEGQPSVEGADAVQQSTDGAEAEQKERPRASILARFSWLQGVSEVQVTRRLYRSGESEFFINRVPCRLRDLKDFFRAVGLSARAYTVVAQGEVSRIITSKPEERRQVLEEASGVSGFRDRIAAARRRLEETSINISRIDDIIKEISRQVGGLKRQAARARNRQILKARLTEIDDQLFRDALLRMEEEESSIVRLKDELQAAEDNLDERLRSAKENEHNSRSQLVALDAEGDRLRRDLEQIRHSLVEREQRRLQRQARLKELGSLIDSRADEAGRLRQRQQLLSERLSVCSQELDELRAKDVELQGLIGETERSGGDDLLDVQARLVAARERLKAHEGALREIREQLIARQSERDALVHQLVSLSPGAQLKATLEQADSSALRNIAQRSALLIDGLKVPARYVRAVQAVLAERLEFLVTDEPLRVARTYLTEVLTDAENATGKGLGVFGQRSDSLPESWDVFSESPLPRLCDFIEVREDLQDLTRRLLGNVYVAENWEEALSVAETPPARPAEPSSFRIVTLEGDIFTPDSFYSFRHEGGALQLKNRKDELEAEISALDTTLARANAERDLLEEDVQRLEVRQTAVLEETRVRESAVRDLSSRQGAVRGRLIAEQSRLEQVEMDLARCEEQLNEALLALDQYEAERKELAAVGEDELSYEIEHLEMQAEEVEERLHEVDEKRRTERGLLESCVEASEEARDELESVRARLAQLDLQFQKLSLRRDGIKERVLAEYGEARWSYLTEDLSFNKPKTPNKPEILDKSETLDKPETLAADGGADLFGGDLFGGVFGDEAVAEGEEGQESDEEGLQAEPAEAAAGQDEGGPLMGFPISEPLSPEERVALEEEAQRIRAKILREGEVDSSSIEQYEQEQARLDALEKERNDLEEARQILRRTLQRLAETSKNRFMSTFERVRKNFSELGPRLFGGGSVSLELTDRSNPLDSGVEVVARPPGKKLKSIELLSGGEKAMCATALILAMFMERPSPLCVLDEVDAPLDEANLGRFLSVIKEMARATQFLIVTHSKLSMISANKLLGVTMQQPGATKLLSVTLEEAVNA